MVFKRKGARAPFYLGGVMYSNISNSEALSLAKRYHCFRSRAGHSWDKKAWIKQLQIQIEIMESLSTQCGNNPFAARCLEQEYATLKMQLNTAMSHVLHS